MIFDEIKKILIIRLSSLGDILLTTPVVRSIKNKYPNLEIDILTRQEYSDIYKYNPHIKNNYSYNKNGNNKILFDKIINQNYDLIIDLQNNHRSGGITQSLGKPVIKFRKPNAKKFLLVNFKLNFLKEKISIPDRYVSNIHNFDLDERGLDLYLPDNISTKIPKDENYIAICPGSKHFTKMYPIEYFVELGNQLSNLGYKIAVVGGKDDKTICEELSSKIYNSINISGEDNLLQIGAEIKNCKFAICNDSGLMHTACAVGTPVITIFGSTVEEFGFSPYKANSLVLQNNSLSCRPCSHIGKKKCPKKHFKCMIEIKPEYILEEIQKFIKTHD